MVSKAIFLYWAQTESGSGLEVRFALGTRGDVRGLLGDRHMSGSGSAPALLDILEKSVRELGAIRLIDSRIGVLGQLARNPRVILGRFRTTIRFASVRRC